MTTRTRFAIILITAPVLAFAVVGGLLGKTLARPGDLPAPAGLRRRLQPDDGQLRRGGRRRSADARGDARPGRGPRRRQRVSHGRADEAAPVGRCGPAPRTSAWTSRASTTCGWSRRATNSPAARAGLRPGDFIRVIGSEPTREMSVWEGMRLLRGAAGIDREARGAARQRRRAARRRADARGCRPRCRRRPGCSSRRSATSACRSSPTARRPRCARRPPSCSVRAPGRWSLDLRGTARGPLEAGIDVGPRRSCASGTLAILESRGEARRTVSAAAGDGDITLPLAVLTDFGTAGAAELFVAALTGNKRAETVGERTHGPGRGPAAVPAARRRRPVDVARVVPHAGRHRDPRAGPAAGRARGPARRRVRNAPPAGDQTLEKAVERLRQPHPRRDIVDTRTCVNRLDTRTDRCV